MDTEMPRFENLDQIIDGITKVLAKDGRVVFAYFYGSAITEAKGNDIDIAVYPDRRADPFSLAVDLKIDMHKETGVAPDAFDVRILSEIIEKGDIFGLLYLKNVVDGGKILVDKDPDVRADFLERYSLRFRECEGLIQEVLA